MLDIGRRRFIFRLGGAAAAPSLLCAHAARAQQSKKAVIGFLGANTAASQSHWTAAFLQRLSERGWVEGGNVAIEFRWGEGRAERFAEIASEFVRMKVDIIVTSGTAPALAAKQATSDIPIVFATSAEPVETGLVASLARPGGNVTGLSTQLVDLATKGLELLREAVIGVRRLAILFNAGAPTSVRGVRVVAAAAGTLGLDVSALEIRRAEDIAPAIDALKGRAEALFVISDPLVFVHRARVNALALGARLPTVHSFREHVEAGGLLAYGPNYPDMFRRSADFVDRILRGAKPADIPVEQPTKFDFAINLKTAKALGLEVPPTLIARADEVIE